MDKIVHFTAPAKMMVPALKVGYVVALKDGMDMTAPTQVRVHFS